MGKILIADDSLYQRKVLSEMVTSLGYDFETVNSGEEVLAMDHLLFDCIFLDLLMPGISGLEVLEQLKDKPEVPPVIVISADVQSKRKEMCFELGAAAFINKVIDQNELEETLNNILT